MSLLFHVRWTKGSRSEVASFSGQYDFGIGESLSAESGLEFAEIRNRSHTDYQGGPQYRSSTRESQAAAYFNLGQQIGKFYYQAGIRSEYLYKHGATG